MLLLAVIIFIAIILVALVIGGIGILFTGGLGLLFAMVDVLVGGFVLWIPIHYCIRKSKKKKEAKSE